MPLVAKTETSFYNGSEFLPGPALSQPRATHAIAKLSPTQYLLWGGTHQGTKRFNVRRYDFETGVWTALNNCPPNAPSGGGIVIKDQSGQDVMIAVGKGNIGTSVKTIISHYSRPNFLLFQSMKIRRTMLLNGMRSFERRILKSFIVKHLVRLLHT